VTMHVAWRAQKVEIRRQRKTDTCTTHCLWPRAIGAHVAFEAKLPGAQLPGTVEIETVTRRHRGGGGRLDPSWPKAATANPLSFGP
jgi:hypothetical protein